MEQRLEPNTALAFAPIATHERPCQIECQGCGAAAEVELEFFVPAALDLRCLCCGSTHVQVTAIPSVPRPSGR